MSVGRPRETARDLPLGVYLVKGRYYARPVNEEMRRIFAVAFPDKKCASLGPDKAEARKLWVKLFVTDLPSEDAQSGTIAELIGRYERDILPTLHVKTKAEHTRYCKTLRTAFGSRRYAKSEVEASTGPFLRSMDLTQYLRLQEPTRPVAANKEIQCFSRIFRLGKTLWGYTEYNPCLQIEYNHEQAREQYHDDDAFMKVYEKASPTMQCMMDLAQMNGSRRGMILRLSLADVAATGPGVWFTLNKRRRNATPKRKLAPWTDDLRDVIQRALELRDKVRGGQKTVADLTTAPLFLNRRGKPWTETGFNSAWQRAARAAGFGKHEFHFHDLKAKAITESASLEDGMKRGDHVEPRTTRRVYTRKPDSVVPLPRVSKKTNNL
jgi:integrase